MDVNYPAVLAAALSTFFIGGLWYSPLLFQKAWMRASGLDEEDLEKGSPVKTFGWASSSRSSWRSIRRRFSPGRKRRSPRGDGGGLGGLGRVALGIAIVALFEQRSWAYVLINGGYFVVAFLAMGAILGGWR
jgi:Protein of unknown function (DUF1761)